MHFMERVELGNRVVDQWLANVVAGIVEKNINAAELAADLGAGGLDIGFLADVPANRDDAPPCAFCQLRGRRGGPLLVAVDNGNISAVAGEAPGHCAPEPGRGAGHQGNLSGQVR